MITVITTNENAVEYNANAYPGMSLAEACNQLQVNTLNAIHDFQMNVLLAEHAYLYENGHEISYINEAGEENSNGKKIRETLVSLVMSAWNGIQNLYDKLIGFIMQRINDVSEFFAKKGMTKNAAQKAIATYGLLYNNSNADEKFEPSTISLRKVDMVKFDKYQSNGKIEEFFKNDNSDPNNPKMKVTLFDDCVAKDKTNDEKITAIDASGAFEAVYNNPKKNLISKVVAERNQANSRIRNIIKEIKVKKELDKSVDDFKNLIQMNSDFCREYIKVYHIHVSNQISILHAVLTNPSVKRKVMEDAKTSIAEKLPKKKPAKDNKSDESGKEASAPAAEEAKNESTIYNGKFFRV